MKAPDRPGPKPWFGCDTNGHEWARYCEAWEHCFKRKHPALRGAIHDRRGKAGLEALDHNIKIVKRDYAGEFDDRTEIARLLR